MRTVVLHTAARTTDAVVEALAGLPEGFTTLELAPAVAVIGPTGVFLVGWGADDPCPVAARLADSAQRLRAAIAEELVPAPFVEAIVVADGHCPPSRHGAVVPPDLLVDAILDGAGGLTGADVDAVVACLTRTGRR